MMGSTSFDPLTNKTIVDGDTASQPIYFGNTGNSVRSDQNGLRLSSIKNVTSYALARNAITAGVTISLNAQEVAVNTDSFVVEQKDLNKEIYVRDERISGSISFSTEAQTSVDHDLQTTNCVSKRKRSPKQLATFQINNPVDEEVVFSPDARYEFDGYRYINGFEIVQWWGRDAVNRLLEEEEVNGSNVWVKINNPPQGADDYDLISLFWNSRNTSLAIKNFYIQNDIFKLFTFSREVTCNYYFKLWAQYGDPGDYRIYSPVFKINNTGRGYRPFELHIDRGNCLALNFDSFEEDYIYEYSFT